MKKWKAEVERRVRQIGGEVISFGDIICNFRYRAVQVNLFLGNGEAWGYVLMWATGPKGHTIGMTIKAQRKNLFVQLDWDLGQGQPASLRRKED